MAQGVHMYPHGIRRRTRSVGSIPSSWLQNNVDICIESDEVGSNNDIGVQSDSDDKNYDQSGCSYSSYHIENVNNSDPVTENTSSFLSVQRKRKFKKLAMDTNSNRWNVHCISIVNRKERAKLPKSVFSPDRFISPSGKRKRISFDKQINFKGSKKCNLSSKISDEHKVLALSKLSINEEQDQQDAVMEVALSEDGTSSISSSSSEAGIYTNDEGREADDEQSDWIGESGFTQQQVYNDMNDPKIGLFSENFDTALNETKKSCKTLMKPNKEGDIRGSKRRVRAVPVTTETHSECSPSPMELDLKLVTWYLHVNEGSSDTGSYKNAEVIKTPSRRNTFSGFKKRKRIRSTLMEQVTDRSSIVTQELSNISSSDSKELPLEDL